ncbi:MAG: alkaline phosphatase family protein [Alphaproteobacteria bacterium]|nr:alkaline phosphatase family protein [Alphaproteobacteria bacterium]
MHYIREIRLVRDPKNIVLSCALALGTLAVTLPIEAASQPHNVVLFVPDGLRALMVSNQTAPTMAAIRDSGVDFKNPHSLFPTFTTPNASAMATGHFLGDTGDFSNTVYSGFPVPGAGGSVTPFLESDPVLGDVDEHFAGDYLDEVTLLKAARNAGISTATIGKLGPALIFDHTDRTGAPTIVVDDSTGTPKGIPLSQEVEGAMTAAGLPLAAPSRGDNGKAGNATTPGAKVANVVQQDYFTDVATKVVLPLFKARNRPFVLVFWSRDPDGTQHNQGDSLNQLTPGINGPTSLTSIKNADGDLSRIQQALRDLGLADTTDIFVTADHGFATISKESGTSTAARTAYADVPQGFLPPGFVAIDIANALHMPLYDPDAKNGLLAGSSHPSRSNGIIGPDPNKPDIVVAANGGSDLVYLPKKDRKLAARVVSALLAQDYVSGLFVDDSLGRIPGTLPLSAINLKGSALTPMPAIAVNFRTLSTGCAQPLNCTVEIADTGLQQGQGMHGSFSRADTMNFMAAIGPDFKGGFTDEAPASNADVGKTLARILGLKIKNKGKLIGRVLTEAMPGGTTPSYTAKVMRSRPAAGVRTILNYELVGRTRYFDAAGFPGRTVGLTGANVTAEIVHASH